MSGDGMGTEQEVAAAEAEAEAQAVEAESLAQALEQAVLEGDEKITADALDSQVKLSRFARLRAEAIRRKAERARGAIRTKQADELRAEIDSYAAGSGTKLAALLRAVADAEKAFLDAGAEHNVLVHQWRQRAVALGIPDSDGRPVPPAEDGRLALDRAGNGLHVGQRRLGLADVKNWLTSHQERGGRDALYAAIGRVDAEEPVSTAKYFYRGPGGAILPRNEPFSAEEINRLQLVILSRKEAWGE